MAKGKGGRDTEKGKKYKRPISSICLNTTKVYEMTNILKSSVIGINVADPFLRIS